MRRRLSNQGKVYQLYSRAYHQVRRISPKVFAAVFTVATVALTATALTLDSLQVQAIAPPLVLGELPYQKYTTKQLSQNTGLKVNVANGNMLLQTSDLSARSVGAALSINRYYNNLGTGSGQVGQKFTLGMGADITITPNSNGSATFQGPSGFKVTFPSNGAGGYGPTADYTYGTLTTISGGGWTLTNHNPTEYYNFNSAGKLISHQDASGNGLDYTYNTNGTLAQVTDAQGKDTFFTNYSGTNVGTITDGINRTVQYGYTSGKLTSVTDVRGNNWYFEYNDGRDNLTEITDPSNNVTTIAYDLSNRVTSVRYDDFTSVTAEWQYAYNNGNTVVTDPLNHATTYTYDASGRVIDTVDANGAHRGAGWDANNNQTSFTNPSGKITTAGFDSLSRQTNRQSPSTAGGAAGAMQSATYNDPNHTYLPSSSTDAGGNITSYSYNSNGATTAITSGAGTVTNKLQDDPDGLGGTINCGAYTGQVCTSIDAKGNATTYSYDTSGNVLEVTLPGPVGKTKYTYDSVSRPITITDGNGSKRTITYNKADQPTKVVYAADASQVTYSYDANGNMTSRVDTAGTTNYSYDGFNQIYYTKTGSKPALNYTYDKAGNLKTEQGPAGTVTYTYDNANQLTNIHQSANNANQTFTYTDGRVTSVGLPGGITQTISYDNSGRQTSIKAMKGATVLTDYTANYAKTTGQDTALMQTETNNLTGVTSTYGYDNLNRLTSVTGTGTGANSFTYTYDANGNRTQYVKNGVTSPTYGFNAANQLTTSGGSSYGTYDLAGNQTLTGANLGLGYNPRSQTTSFTPSGSTAISASYTDAGQTQRTQFGTKAQLNGLLGLYSDTTSGTATYYVHMPTGTNQTTGQVIGGTAYYYLTDLRGSVVKMTNASGVVQNTYTYDPYGNTLASTGSVANPIRYAGGYYDTQTGLYKFGARYYNATDARWTQLDPSGQDFGYIYASNNPVNYMDPSGYFTIIPTAFIINGINLALDSYFGRCTANLIRAEGLTILGAAALAPQSAGVSLGIGFTSLIGFNAAQKELC